MKKISAAVVSLAMAVSACGCANSNNRALEGAAVGGIVGAGAGAIIGHQSGSGGKGALLGGALGALAGSLVGSNIKKEPAASQDQAAKTSQGEVTQTAASSASSQQVSVDEIVTMAGQGVNDDVIIDRIRLTNSKFSLTPAQVDMLKQKGVSQRVINAMQGIS